MTGTAAVVFTILTINIIGVYTDGEFDVLYSPSSLKWTEHTRQLKSLKDVYSASLGLSVDQSSEDLGLSIVDPFNTPEAVAEVYIVGVATLGDPGRLKYVRYPLKLGGHEPDTFNALKRRIRLRSANSANKLASITLADKNELKQYAHIFGKIGSRNGSEEITEYLKPRTVKEDALFIQELQVLRDVIEKVSSGVVSPDNKIDFYQLRFQSLHALSNLHGVGSRNTKEAQTLLKDALGQLSAAFQKAYRGAVLVTSVCSDAAVRARSARQTDGEEEEAAKDTQSGEEGSPKEDEENEKPNDAQEAETATEGGSESKAHKPGLHELNLAETYSEDFPVMFHIMLWLGIGLVFTLLAVTYAIMDMDPGRDSVIYRMTCTRGKKDM